VRFFEDIPEELLESAQLDGASQFRIFWSIVLPLARPALATIALFYLVFHWNEFFRAMIYLNDQSKWPLQVVLRQFVIGGDKVAIVGADNAANNIGIAQINIRALKAGMILITIVPILAVYPLILRYFTKGTMVGAVKG
jgi:putative aldouronate transport system permease protein